MKQYKVAPTQVGKMNVVVVWIDIKYKNDEKEIQNYMKYFKNVFGIEEIVLMVVDDLDVATYFGKKEIIEALKITSWKRLQFQEVTVEKKR